MEAFNVLTQFFSRADLPATCYALRSLNNLVVRISDEAANSSSAAIRAAAQLGCAKIRKYLRILKEKELYQFSAVFNPSIKKTFFESRPAQYPASWLNGVLARMDEVFRTCYLAGDESPSAGVQAEPMTFEDEMFGLSPVKTSNTAPGARGRGARGGVRAEHTAFAAELEHYLATPRDKTSDVISWWLAHRGTYPNLHRMALDYVSAPGTTIEVERLFSTGRILLSHLRNRMSEESVHSILSLRSWFGTNFLDKRDFDLGPSQ
ncbi:hATC-domain-containing protein [Exidia glandulosa HHB12029]|uniref:HATC-domain-containing protein n=1 Tax=Exidia glandulosa HHB12029 TaxID=1314781 RepID=A0A165IHX1_EXIGL|nr:hATC-domain-containing protein [Exidia glandulosa HHB12029]